MSSVVDQARNMIGRLSKRHSISTASTYTQNRNPYTANVEVSAKFGKYYLEKIANLNQDEQRNAGPGSLQTMMLMSEIHRKNEFGSGL